MTWLNRLLRSESPKLERPVKTVVGRLMQKTRRFEHVLIPRDGYRLPFFSSSNFALTYWVAPDLVDPTEEFVRSVLRPGAVFVDVGANVGTVSALAAGVVGPSGTVVAIEPHPTTFDLLCRTIDSNGLANVTPLPVACGATAGMARLTNERRKDDNNKMDDTGAGIAVAMTTLANVLGEQSLEKVDLLKIDVEGFECAVLRGLAGKFSTIGALYLEVIEANLHRYGDSTAAVVSLLQENGFACFEIANDATNLVAFSTAAQVSACDGDLVEVPGNPVLDNTGHCPMGDLAIPGAASATRRMVTLADSGMAGRKLLTRRATTMTAMATPATRWARATSLGSSPGSAPSRAAIRRAASRSLVAAASPARMMQMESTPWYAPRSSAANRRARKMATPRLSAMPAARTAMPLAVGRASDLVKPISPMSGPLPFVSTWAPRCFTVKSMRRDHRSGVA